MKVLHHDLLKHIQISNQDMGSLSYVVTIKIKHSVWLICLGHYWLKISFSSPARMELCPRFNLVIMPLCATAHAQICCEGSLTTLVFASSAIINCEV